MGQLNLHQCLHKFYSDRITPVFSDLGRFTLLLDFFSHAGWGKTALQYHPGESLHISASPVI
jgi:hypothetical protein